MKNKIEFLINITASISISFLMVLIMRLFFFRLWKFDILSSFHWNYLISLFQEGWKINTGYEISFVASLAGSLMILLSSIYFLYNYFASLVMAEKIIEAFKKSEEASIDEDKNDNNNKNDIKTVLKEEQKTDVIKAKIEEAEKTSEIKKDEKIEEVIEMPKSIKNSDAFSVVQHLQNNNKSPLTEEIPTRKTESSNKSQMISEPISDKKQEEFKNDTDKADEIKREELRKKILEKFNTSLKNNDNKEEDNNSSKAKKKDKLDRNSNLDSDKREEAKAKLKEISSKLKKQLNELVKEDKDNKIKENNKPANTINIQKKEAIIKNNNEKLGYGVNTVFEKILSKSGYKTISNVLLGKYNMPFVSLSKNSANILYIDDLKGNWISSENATNGKEPIWYDENDSGMMKVSPVYKLIKSKKILEKILKEKANFKGNVSSTLCITQQTISNFEELQNEAKNNNINILKLGNTNLPDDIPEIVKYFTDIKEEEISNEDFNKIKSLLKPDEDMI